MGNLEGPGRVGAQSGLGPGPGWGPYGPIWALMGPYMGPYGSSWTGLGRFRKLSVNFRKTFGQISHVSGPKLAF